jgi:hypothetical protein
MPVSFWIFLFVCLVSFILVIRDHGESWTHFKKATGKEKCRKASHLFAIWFVPVFTLIGTLFLGRESFMADRNESRFSSEINSLSNELVEANQKIAPRSLTEIQRALLISMVNVTNKGFVGPHLATPPDWKPGIVVVSPMGDPEAADFSDDFISAFRSAGWNAWPNRLLFSSGYGVQLRIMPTTPEYLPGLRQLRQALKLNNIPFEEVPITESDGKYINQTIQEDGIYLYIGHKSPK